MLQHIFAIHFLTADIYFKIELDCSERRVVFHGSKCHSDDSFP